MSAPNHKKPKQQQKKNLAAASKPKLKVSQQSASGKPSKPTSKPSRSSKPATSGQDKSQKRVQSESHSKVKGRRVKPVTDDDRFAHVHNDPRFQSLPKQKRKVKIDQRFKGMFEEKEFQMNYVVDKHGRRIQKQGTDDIKRFYELDDEEKVSGSEHSSSEGENQRHPWMQELTSSSSSDSDSDESSEEEAEEVLEIVPREQATHRLAVVKMEWDRVKAVDLLVLLRSFVSETGVVKSVTIYPTTFGLKRMEEEKPIGKA